MRLWFANEELVERAPRPADLSAVRLDIPSAILALLALGSVLALGLWIQLRIYPNHDVAWVLWGARAMMHGATYGTDIIEPNPPLAWYLSMPTTALSEWLGVPLDLPFRIMLGLLGALSAASLIWLRPAKISALQALVLAVVAAVGMVVLVGREFGQRDPIAIILVLPYLALSGRRLDSEPAPPASAVVIGLVGGLGFALKPYFLAVPMLIELCLLTFGRQRRLFRPENISAAAVIFVYGASVLIFDQAYLRNVVPLVREIYWTFDSPFLFVFLPFATQLLCVGGLALIAFPRKDGLSIVLFASLVGFGFSYLIQAKGYSYHLVPVRTVALLIAARFLVDKECSQMLRITALVQVGVLAFLWWLPFRAWWSVAQPGGGLYREIEEINDSISRHANGGSFLVVAVRTYPSFPAGIYAPASYISRTNGQWFLPAVAQLRASGIQSASTEKHARDFILYDLRSRPTLVLIDKDSRGHTRGPANFDFLAFYNEDPKFREIWRSYREVEPISHFRQFVYAPGQRVARER